MKTLIIAGVLLSLSLIGQTTQAPDKRAQARDIREQAEEAESQLNLAYFRANTKKFEELDRQLAYVNLQLQFMLCEQDWHRTSVFYKVGHRFHDPCKAAMLPR